ncbi:ABC transporter ATP-binding protein [Clostridium sp. SM-530-WT-3G]|uniref:ABC transporter ATP-binding protein n=1 Tax=Clostridium sp. SM-530-WT-3G TaxID=2725303 RepID=UPI00145D49F5|nr:ABC transporter ATP-binding protein [Clostridium sp. SM-530-WT-3G]NME83876.1 ABC transporter ATP-binding protein [Clostridium sp. SM-530-WT-3G]
MNIEITNLNKSYDKRSIFKDFNIKIVDDKINCIIGPSGCGKTTFLNIVAGILEYDSGSLNGILKSDISYIFQEDRLIEWLTVKENLQITLKKYFDKINLDNEIEKLLDIVGIKEVKDKYPNELSGGMRQRVNIARAFGKPSKIILMDEPFKSLDYKLKYTIIDEFKNILNKRKRLVILATHDIDEAIYFNGRIFLFGNSPVKVLKVFEEELQKAKNEIISFM